MIAILGKGFISCLISSNNRKLQLLSFQKIYTLLGVIWNVWPWSNDYARLSFGAHWYLKKRLTHASLNICFNVSWRHTLTMTTVDWDKDWTERIVMEATMEPLKGKYWARTEVKMLVNTSLSQLKVVNSKCDTLREGETKVFLCEPETFWIYF